MRARYRSLKKFLFFVLAVSLVGCDGGGGNCPWERPSCCDNNLFGCGPFDLPQGCSCGDYFSRSFQGFSIQSKTAPVRATSQSMEGTWRMALTKTGGGCSYLKSQSTATALIRERNQQVSIKMLGFVTLRGSRSGRFVRPRGQMRIPFPRCTADVSSNINQTSATTATVSGSVAVTCQNKSLSCSASYSGNLKKL